MIPRAKEKKAALDMAFGESPDTMEKVNMFCSRMQYDAIYSLILSATNLKHLELRGNNLNADFGWKVIKAMKNNYLHLQTMNGMNVGAIKDNQIKHLNLVGFRNGNGIFGIEVVGAIFLAHYLRVNRSLESIKFQNNNVEKEGAKAISQAILSTPDSNIRSVNHMGKRPKTDKGIDLQLFRKGQVPYVDLSHCNVDDDDLVFLVEWLERYDCVGHLDLSHNMIRNEGIIKLTRYLANTKTLKSFNLAMAPLELTHIVALTKALKENATMERVNFHIGRACGMDKDKQQMLHDLALVIAQHPSIKEFGSSPVKVDLIKGNYMASYDPLAQKKVAKSRNDIAMALWLIAMCKPSSFYTLSYNNNRRSDNAYPEIVEFVPFYWSPISSICLQLKDTLVNVDLGVPEGMRDVVDIMKFLSGSASLKKLFLRGYAGTQITQVPQEWQDDGRLPSWLRNQIGKRRLHWQALQGFTAATPGLLMFNNVNLANYKPDAAERAVLLLIETVIDAVCVHEKGGSQTTLNFMFGKRADVLFCLNATRVVDRAPYKIIIRYAPEVTYVREKVREVTNLWKFMALQQHDIANFLQVASRGNDDAPKFVHHLKLDYPFVTPIIVDAMAVSTNIREFTIDAIEKILPNLIASFKANNTHVERINCERYWLQKRRVLKKFHENEQEQLRVLQQAISNQSDLQEFVSPAGRFSKANLQKSTLEEFAQKVSGVLVKYPPVSEVYSPNIMVEFVFDPKASKYPPANYKRLGMMLPLAPAHRHIKELNLANCHIKREIRNTARSDEFADSSRPLWEGKMATYRPHLFGPFEEKKGYDFNSYMRFHWHPNIRVGSSKSEKFLKSQGFVVEKDLLRLIIITLLKSPSLTSLDLRGNGFDKEDIMVVINQLEHNKYLKLLNGIPVVAAEANKMSKLEFDGTGIPPISPNMRESGSEDRAYGHNTCKYGVVSMDEGDGFLFASLVTSNNFQRLKHLSIKRHRIPDSALTYICDAIASLPALENLELQNVYVSNRGANMLLSVIAQRSATLQNLNGLPINMLKGEVQNGNKSGGYVVTKYPIVWNDFTLAIATRLKLWAALRESDDEGKSMVIDTRGLTDVGLRGIAGKTKWEAAEASRSMRLLPIIKLDLSNNHQITDTALADICRNLLQPSERPTLQYLDTRYCPKLRARSAFELYYLLHPKTRPTKSMGTSKLQIVNGMDIKLLHDSVRAGKPAPPFVIRLFAGEKQRAPVLSESDSHFFAHVLHMFPNVSHCHVHVEVSQKHHTAAWLGETQIDEVTSASPFRAPAEDPVDEVQKQIDSTVLFFESCPVSTRTQFSCIPRIAVRTPKPNMEGDVVVPFFTGATAAAESPGHFGQMVKALLAKKDNRLRQLGIKPGQKRKPYYVNNINAQRMHDCFRTLYGVDDVELFHEDVFNPRNRRQRVMLNKVDFSKLFSICSSLDVQHLGFHPDNHLNYMKNHSKSLTINLLTHLNFAYSNFGDPGVRSLCQMLVDASAHVIHLGLAWNSISDAGVRHLCAALPHMSKISSLDLANNFISETGGIVLADRLGGYELTKQGSPYFSDDVKILSLNLEGNKIRDKGAMRIAEFITVNKYLQFLNLRDNEIGFVHDEAIAALVYCVTDNHFVSVCDIRDNFQKKRKGTNRYEKTRPPLGLMQGLIKDVSVADFDENEVLQGIFIRRKR